MIERKPLAWHHYCKHACRYLGDQIKVIESDPEGMDIVVPSRMCPLAATLAIEAAVENITHQEPDSYVAAPGSHAQVERDALVARAEQVILDYDINTVQRCARKLIRQGSDNIPYEEVATISDSEVYEMISNLTGAGD